jgi:nicotinamide mononucleotide adenylyltransferase
MKKKAVIVSGYFNPIHKGHLEYFNNATIPERPMCENIGSALIDGLEEKVQSSSWLLKKL